MPIVDDAIAHLFWRGVAPAEIKEMRVSELRYWRDLSKHLADTEAKAMRNGH